MTARASGQAGSRGAGSSRHSAGWPALGLSAHRPAGRRRGSRVRGPGDPRRDRDAARRVPRLPGPRDACMDAGRPGFGAVAGDQLGYLLGRLFGPRLRASRLGRLVGEDRWAKASASLRVRGGRAVFVGRFVGVLRALVPALAGMARMPYRVFGRGRRRSALGRPPPPTGSSRPRGGSWSDRRESPAVGTGSPREPSPSTSRSHAGETTVGCCCRVCRDRPRRRRVQQEQLEQERLSPPTTAAPATTAAAGGATVAVNSSKLGRILVDAKGRTLYLFEKDKGTTSSCYGACAGGWPPYTTPAAPQAGGGATASLLGTTTRTDGTTQVTYKDHPLYYFVGDKQPGEVTGEGVNAFGAKWYVLAPSGNKIDKD